LLDAPHAAMDSAVAPVTASSATRDSRVVEKVAGIGVLSIVGRKSADRHWQRSSRSAAPLSAGWCPIKSALCTRLGRAKAVERVAFWA
jgi:hypothetical protein